MPKMVLGIEFSSKKDAMFMQMLIKKYCPKMQGNDQDAFIQTVKEKQGIEPFENGQISRPISFDVRETAWFNSLTETFNVD